MRPEELAKTLDLTILKANLKPAQIEAACLAARENHFAAVTVGPDRVAQVRGCMFGSDVKTCAIIGLPHGDYTLAEKLADVTTAVADGADELDILLNTNALRRGSLIQVRDELLSIVRTARARASVRGRGNVLLKAIVDAPLLDEKLTRLACKIIVDVECDFATAGSSVTVPRLRDVELMRECLPGEVGVGAGGIANLDAAEEMIGAGASRLGSEAAGAIVEAFLARKG